MKTLMKIIALSMLVFCTACLDDEEPYAKNIEAPGQILFVIPDADRPLAPVNQEQIVQPSYSLISGRFRPAGTMSMTVQLSDGLTNLSVNLVPNTGVRQLKATLNNISGSVDLSLPMATLGPNNTPLTTGSIVLEFVASNSDNTAVVKRMFTVGVRPN